jgi:hypothetical protein
MPRKRRRGWVGEGRPVSATSCKFATCKYAKAALRGSPFGLAGQVAVALRRIVKLLGEAGPGPGTSFAWSANSSKGWRT